MSTPVEGKPARRTTMSWSRGNRPRLAEDEARRQGEITQLAFLLLGREAAMAFLNSAHAGLGGRPLDLAIASDQGRNNVEAEIGRIAYAGPRDDLPGDRRQRSREPAEAHFRHLHDAHDPRAATPDGAGTE